MNQRAIDDLTTAVRGHADVRRILAGHPKLYDEGGLSAAGRVFASTFSFQLGSGATGRQAEQAALKAAGLS